VVRAHNLHDKPARGNACLRALSAGTAVPGTTIRPLATMNNDTSQKPKALLHCDWVLKDAWAESIRQQGIPLAVWPDVDDYGAIEMYIGWRYPEGIFSKLTNLKAVQLLGAGVETVINNPDIPETVPLLRVADPLMGVRLATWVVWAVTNTQRHMDTYLEHQRKHDWYKSLEGWVNKDNQDITVGIMGLGVMGRATTDALKSLGYRVMYWTRTQRSDDNSYGRAFFGRDQLPDFVSHCEYLVCLLPLTPETEHIINAELLSWLPKGATVINGARGKHMVEADVLAALDAGQLGQLITDVTDPEPLPEESRLWQHPRVRLTPHVAAFTPVPTAAAQIGENYRAMQEGQPYARERVVDRSAGY
jgi:glyoxylate/hydroxypyruvate reductase A